MFRVVGVSAEDAAAATAFVVEAPAPPVSNRSESVAAATSEAGETAAGELQEEDQLGVVVEELGETGDVQRGRTLPADGRLELCQLSKLLQCVRARDLRMIDNLVDKVDWDDWKVFSYYSAPGTTAEDCDKRVGVCLSVCQRAYL